MKMIQKNMNKKGFTLVELIIVIAVMAILAAIVVPRMTGVTQAFRERADERVCASFAREIQVMIQSGALTVSDNDSGIVSTVGSITIDGAPQSNAANTYYYYIDETQALNTTNGNPQIVTVYVYVGSATISAVPTTGIFAQVTNVQVIN
ncbi:MAG: type II secretion system protein [Clostridiales bacterium]|nr:type II secretion system protein [Clostridiales bacterium]